MRLGPLSPMGLPQQRAGLNAPDVSHGSQSQQGKEWHGGAQAQDAPGDGKENLASPTGLRMRGHRTQPAPRGILCGQEGTPSKDWLAKAKSSDPGARLNRLSTIPSMEAMPSIRPLLHRRGRSMSRTGSCNDAGIPPLQSGLLLPEDGPSPAKASPLRAARAGDARRKAEALTPWQKVMAVDWHPVRLLGRGCQLPAPRFSDVWLLFACMIWPPSAFTSDGTTRSGEAFSSSSLLPDHAFPTQMKTMLVSSELPSRICSRLSMLPVLVLVRL